MKLLNVEDVKWIEDSFDDVKKLTENLDKQATVEIKEVSKPEEKNVGTFAKIKNFVRKAVDCCIE